MLTIKTSPKTFPLWSLPVYDTSFWSRNWHSFAIEISYVGLCYKGVLRRKRNSWPARCITCICSVIWELVLPFLGIVAGWRKESAKLGLSLMLYSIQFVNGEASDHDIFRRIELLIRKLALDASMLLNLPCRHCNLRKWVHMGNIFFSYFKLANFLRFGLGRCKKRVSQSIFNFVDVRVLLPWRLRSPKKLSFEPKYIHSELGSHHDVVWRTMRPEILTVIKELLGYAGLPCLTY